MPARTKKTATPVTKADSARTCLRLQVELLSGKGLLFRVHRPGCLIDILPTQTLDDLHEAIHRACNRSEQHLYYFTLSNELPHEAGEHYTIPDEPGTPDYDRNAKDSRTTTMKELKLKEGQSFHYLYDFVHDWWHKITVVSLQEKAPEKIVYPRIEAYTGAAAPDETLPLYKGAADGDTITYALMPPHLQDVAKKIYGLIRAFCDEKLTPEYEKFCGRLLYACGLAELHLDRGKPESWAAAIVYAIGSSNGLFFPDSHPHMRATEIGPAFGVSAATAQNKGRQLCKDFDIQYFDSHYTTLGESCGYGGPANELLTGDPEAVASAIIAGIPDDIQLYPEDIALMDEQLKGVRGESALFSRDEAEKQLAAAFPGMPIELLEVLHKHLAARALGTPLPADEDDDPVIISADDAWDNDDEDEDDEGVVPPPAKGKSGKGK